MGKRIARVQERIFMGTLLARRVWLSPTIRFLGEEKF